MDRRGYVAGTGDGYDVAYDAVVREISLSGDYRASKRLVIYMGLCLYMIMAAVNRLAGQVPLLHAMQMSSFSTL